MSPLPHPAGGAVLVTSSNRIIGRGVTTYDTDCIQAALSSAGVVATPLREWCVTWPSNRQLREEISGATLYLTLEPSADRKGSALPAMTQLVSSSGIQRVVIGYPNPTQRGEGASALHAAGLDVIMGLEESACSDLISEYAPLAASKVQKMARNHFQKYNRPLGLLHCSVVDSTDIDAFARNGNSFGKDFGGGQLLSTRDVGSYAIAPPPETIWATSAENADEPATPLMPWYYQVDAVVATFPRIGNIPDVTGRLNGLRWLATEGERLPPAVERILVADASDLDQIPITNDDPKCPKGLDIESFWKSVGRKKTRILLRHGTNARAQQAADAAAKAAESAYLAAQKARDALESGEAELAAESAIVAQEAANGANGYLQQEVQEMLDVKERLTSRGVIIETMKGGKSKDVMDHLGERNGYSSVVWRAGCWGERGVKAISSGAFQWVSAHLAVDANGGKFWQLMLAERCVQAACGAEQDVMIIAEQEDISLEYCDDADQDCFVKIDGQPVRHVRLDSRIGLVEKKLPIKGKIIKNRPIKKKFQGLKGHKEEAPWFL